MLEIEAIGAVTRGAVLTVSPYASAPGNSSRSSGPTCGKTTLFRPFRVSCRRCPAIRFEGNDLLAVAPSARPAPGYRPCSRGEAGVSFADGTREPGDGRRTETGRRNWAENLDKVYTWFPVLAERASAQAGALSGGQQQMLAIARGLASSPSC